MGPFAIILGILGILTGGVGIFGVVFEKVPFIAPMALEAQAIFPVLLFVLGLLFAVWLFVKLFH